MNPEEKQEQLTVQQAPDHNIGVPNQGRRQLLKDVLHFGVGTALGAVGVKTAEVAAAASETPANTEAVAEMSAALGINIPRQIAENAKRAEGKSVEVPPGFIPDLSTDHASLTNLFVDGEVFTVRHPNQGTGTLTLEQGHERTFSGVVVYDADDETDTDQVVDKRTQVFISYPEGAAPDTLAVVKYVPVDGQLDTYTWQRIAHMPSSSIDTQTNKARRSITFDVATGDNNWGTYAFIDTAKMSNLFDESGNSPVVEPALLSIPSVSEIGAIPGVKHEIGGDPTVTARDSTHFVPTVGPETPKATETLTATETPEETVEATPPAKTVTPTQTPEAPATPPTDTPPLAEPTVAEPHQSQPHKLDLPIAFGDPNK